MIEEADSLLRLYSYIGHSGFHATGIPIWDVATLEKLRHGLCTHKCWHNALLFSSLGIAAATDIFIIVVSIAIIIGQRTTCK